ncbi:MAG: hypothetical protein ACFE9Z_01690 [Promethearchaeota archaeon]
MVSSKIEISSLQLIGLLMFIFGVFWAPLSFFIGLTNEFFANALHFGIIFMIFGLLLLIVGDIAKRVPHGKEIGRTISPSIDKTKTILPYQILSTFLVLAGVLCIMFAFILDVIFRTYWMIYVLLIAGCFVIFCGFEVLFLFRFKAHRKGKVQEK